MKIESLKSGQVVYSLIRRKMGNTTLSSTELFEVMIESISPDKQFVVASWNDNRPERFYAHDVSRWRLKKPLMIRGMMGATRLATRAEIAAHDWDKPKGKG